MPAALDLLTRRLRKAGVRMGSHDDQTSEDRKNWQARGVEISEFPETIEAAEAAHAAMSEGRSGDTLEAYETALRRGAVGRDLKIVRNVAP